MLTLISAAIGSIVMFAMIKMMQGTNRGYKHADLKNDVNAIKQLILNSVDCGRTLQSGNPVGGTVSSPVNLTSGNDCDPSSTNYKLLTLQDSNGNSLGAPLETATGNLQNTSKFGAWNLLTQCDRINHSIIIRAVIAKSGGGFGEDPLTKRTYDFTPDNSFYLFGGGNTVKLCQEKLGGTPAAGYYSGALYGGAYQQYTYESANQQTIHTGSSCRMNNQVVSPPSCNCPTGFLANLIHEWSTNCSLGFYWDSVAWGPPPPAVPLKLCGVVTFICYKTI